MISYGYVDVRCSNIDCAEELDDIEVESRGPESLKQAAQEVEEAGWIVVLGPYEDNLEYVDVFCSEACRQRWTQEQQAS